MEISEFYAARLDEDERIAQGAARTDDGHHGNWLPMHFGAGGFDARVDDHIAHYDPARALREVEAGRSALAEYKRVQANYGGKGDVANGLALSIWYHAFALRAAVYSDHPDYDPDWAVSA